MSVYDLQFSKDTDFRYGLLGSTEREQDLPLLVGFVMNASSLTFVHSRKMRVNTVVKEIIRNHVARQRKSDLIRPTFNTLTNFMFELRKTIGVKNLIQITLHISLKQIMIENYCCYFY